MAGAMRTKKTIPVERTITMVTEVSYRLGSDMAGLQEEVMMEIARSLADGPYGIINWYGIYDMPCHGLGRIVKGPGFPKFLFPGTNDLVLYVSIVDDRNGTGTMDVTVLEEKILAAVEAALPPIVESLEARFHVSLKTRIVVAPR